MVANRSRRVRRAYLVLTRWLSLICCGVVAGVVLLALEPFTHPLGETLASRLAMLHPLQICVLLSVLACPACWFVGRRRWRGFLGVRFLFTYPPLWVAMIIGLGTWLGGTLWLLGIERVSAILGDVLWFQSQVPSVVWWFILLVLAVLSLATVLPYIAAVLQGGREVTSEHERDHIRANDFDALRHWLQDDSEVAAPADDRFGHDEIARRMAARLMEPNEASTMAVVGMLGSGKSTIQRLVAHHLRYRPTVRLVDVSVWPFDSAQAAVRGILRAIVRELGRHVNVLPLVGLSDDYVTAIEKTARSYGGIARLLRGSSDPEQILQRFSDIACAAGLRLVLWVEDLERFSGGDQLEGEPRIEREVERLGPIRALLHLLDRCPQISVVISDTSLRTRFDLGKIARFVEQPPAMDAERVWNVTALLRYRCLGGYPITVIDPASPEARRQLTPKRDAHQVSAWLSSFRDLQPSIPAAIAHTLKTPRALKSALRITLEPWEKFPGEIDLDSVLVASVLRVARPDLFAIVSEHIELFRHGLTDPFTVSGEKKPHRVVEQIDKLLANEDERSAASLRALLSYLFPKYPPEGANNDWKDISRPQALFVDRYADYWRRYLAQEPVDEAKSDQRALKSMMAWRNQESSDLIDRMIDPERSDQIEQFVGQFRPAELCRLMRDISDRLARQSAAGWEDQTHAAGIMAVWRMMLVRQPPEDVVFQTVLDIVQHTAPANLPLAYDVTHFFAASSSGVPPLMSEEQRKEVARTLQGALPENFIGDGAEERLLRAFKDGSPWLIFRIAWSVPPVDGHSSTPFERWPEFGNVLLNLAETHPTVGVPFVVPFITRSNMATGYRQNENGDTQRVGRWVGQFDVETAKRLFDFDRLVRILAQFQLPDDLDEQMKAHCRAAVEAAQAHTSTLLESPAPVPADSRTSSS